MCDKMYDMEKHYRTNLHNINQISEQIVES